MAVEKLPLGKATMLWHPTLYKFLPRDSAWLPAALKDS
jgi:hypothetical protein